MRPFANARELTLSLLLTSLALAHGAAWAVTPLSGAWLERHCMGRDEIQDGTVDNLCVTYIQGFLDGAVATDERVARNVAAEYESGGFVDRATRTRLGPRLRAVRTFGFSAYAEYCLGAPVPIREVIDHVIEKLRASPPAAGTLARDIVYETLREHYPCPGE